MHWITSSLMLRLFLLYLRTCLAKGHNNKQNKAQMLGHCSKLWGLMDAQRLHVAPRSLAGLWRLLVCAASSGGDCKTNADCCFHFSSSKRTSYSDFFQWAKTGTDIRSFIKVKGHKANFQIAGNAVYGCAFPCPTPTRRTAGTSNGFGSFYPLLSIQCSVWLRMLLSAQRLWPVV